MVLGPPPPPYAPSVILVGILVAPCNPSSSEPAPFALISLAAHSPPPVFWKVRLLVRKNQHSTVNAPVKFNAVVELTAK